MSRSRQPIDAMQCHQCHSFTSTAAGHCFCSADCAHEWSALRLHNETPSQFWLVVTLARALYTSAPEHKAANYGKLMQAAETIWGKARQPPPAAAAAPNPNKQ